MPGRVTFDHAQSRAMPGFEYAQRPSSEAGTEAIRGNVQATPLNQAYFSPQNFQIIQNAIRYQVYLKSGNVIDPVSSDDLYIAMRSIYLQYGRNLPTQIREQIEELNERVVAWCLPRILSEIAMDKRYVKDITTMPVPLAHPVNINNAGTKSLPFKAFM